MELSEMIQGVLLELDQMGENEIKEFQKDWEQELKKRGMFQRPEIRVLTEEIIDLAISRKRNDEKIKCCI